MLSITRAKTLGLIGLILLSIAKSSAAAEIEFSDKAKLLNNLPQLEKLLNSEFDKNHYRFKISLNDLNEKISPAQCGTAQWSIPAGTVLKGRVALLARCRIAGEIVQYYQPADIRVHATIAVAARALRFNEVVEADAIRMEERDITHLTGFEPLDKPEELSGQQTRRAIAQGLPLRREMFEPQPLVRAGDSIKVVITGEGFRLSTEAVALQAGQPGQQIRVKTLQGKVLTGAVSAQQVVELRL